MLLKLKNKDTLTLDSFKFKCSIGRKGLNKFKKEGDGATPKGLYGFGILYWRKDRALKPITKLKCKVIRRNLGWCNDVRSKHYNTPVLLNSKCNKEKLFRKDHKYDYLLVIKYNTKKIVKGKGSAIFLHLTRNYKKTAGCVAVKLNDFLIIVNLLKRNSKIKLH